MQLVRFYQAAEQGVVGFLWYHQQIGQGGCRVLVAIVGGMCRNTDHFGFASFTLDCRSDQLSPIWHIVAQLKLIGGLWMVCPVGFPTALPSVGYTPWSKRMFRRGRERQASIWCG